MAQRVHLLTLIVDASGAIERMKLEEMDGATTEFTFSQVEEDICAACLRVRLHPTSWNPHRQRSAAHLEARFRYKIEESAIPRAPICAEEQPSSDFRR